MGNLRRLTGLLGALLFVGSCGHNTGSGEPDAKAPIGNIKIDAYVSQGHRDAMAASLDYLDQMLSFTPDTRFMNLMGLAELTGKSLHQWLEDRVGFILDEIL